MASDEVLLTVQLVAAPATQPPTSQGACCGPIPHYKLAIFGAAVLVVATVAGLACYYLSAEAAAVPQPPDPPQANLCELKSAVPLPPPEYNNGSLIFSLKYVTEVFNTIVCNGPPDLSGDNIMPPTRINDDHGWDTDTKGNCYNATVMFADRSLKQGVTPSFFPGMKLVLGLDQQYANELLLKLRCSVLKAPRPS